MWYRGKLYVKAYALAVAFLLGLVFALWVVGLCFHHFGAV